MPRKIPTAKLRKEYGLTRRKFKQTVATTLQTAIELFEQKEFTQKAWARSRKSLPFEIHLSADNIDTEQICSCCLMGAVRIAIVMHADIFTTSDQRNRAYNATLLQLENNLYDEPDAKDENLHIGTIAWNDKLNPADGKQRCLALLRRSYANLT